MGFKQIQEFESRLGKKYWLYQLEHKSAADWLNYPK
jgi:hypothetical protein